MNNELRTMNSSFVVILRRTGQKSGFSLSEVLIAVGILAMGLVFIAGTFPVGIGLTTVAVERTTAAVVAEEAFAKIKLYGVNPGADWPNPDDPAEPQCLRYEMVASVDPDPAEFAYPSTGTAFERQYYWSALCRRVDPIERLVQVTVFVSRKTNPGLTYPDPKYPDPDPDRLYDQADWPRPVRLPAGDHGWLQFDRDLDPKTIAFVLLDFSPPLVPPDVPYFLFFTPSATILDDQTGQLYRIQNAQREGPNREVRIITLDRPWQGSDPPQLYIWVVPPPVGGGRYPCIGIYQRIIRF